MKRVVFLLSLSVVNSALAQTLRDEPAPIQVFEPFGGAKAVEPRVLEVDEDPDWWATVLDLMCPGEWLMILDIDENGDEYVSNAQCIEEN